MMAVNDSSTCSFTNRYLIHIVGSLGAISMATCLLALCWLCYLKLHRKFLYRLAAYQVMASLSHAMFYLCQFTFVEYNSSEYPSCITVGFLLQVSGWLKVCFGCWVTFHLFCFAVLLKNMKKLEPLYVISSVLLAIVVSSIPLITFSYGPTGEWCWIREKLCEYPNNDDIGIFEQIGVWYAPAFVLLVLQLVAMFWMMITLYHRAHRRSDNVFGREQNKKAFKQLLPLVSYPLFFIVLMIPSLIDHMCEFFRSTPSVLHILSAASVPLWSFSAGLTLIIHIGVVRCADIKRSLVLWFCNCIPTRRTGYDTI